MKIAVSACLMGENCKYNGGNNLNARVVDFIGDKEYIKICPEVLAGLGTPRVPIEIVDGEVLTWIKIYARRLRRYSQCLKKRK